MRKKLTLYIACGLLAFAQACNVLDQQPELQIDENQAIVDENSANTAVNGLYSQLQRNAYYGFEFQSIGYLSGDNVTWRGSLNFYLQFNQRNVIADNQTILLAWTGIYRTINQANNIIAVVPTLTVPGFTDPEKNQLVGEARFVRALCYFDLIRTWGGVPLVTTPTRGVDESARVSRAPVEQGWNQVQADLTEAENLLPDNLNRNRATRKTVRALRARYHLYRQQWADAERYATQVITDNSFELVRPYSAFYSGINTRESILELAFNNADQNSHNFYWLPSADGGRYEWGPSEAIMGLLRDPNVGGNRSAAVRGTNALGICNMYFRAATDDDPAYLLRIAEMYLIRAEARARQNNISGGLADLNAVRARAEAPANNAAQSQEAMLLAVEEERRVEFAFEPHRWYDLVRTNRAQAVLGVQNAQRLLMPLPVIDLQANPNLQQNPGY
jgi:hypothetical protein